MRPCLLRFASILACLLLAIAASSFGSGFSIFEQGAKASAMGGAFAATADDPSALFYNVSGIAYQREMAASTGGTIIMFQAEFHGDNNEYPGPGVRESYADHVFTPPNAYVVIPFGENMTFGLGMFTAFGLRTDWDQNHSFSGRFISKDANLKTTSIQPSFAMKTSHGMFAWGAGLEYRVSHVQLERNLPAINPFTQRITDIAVVRLDSDWDGGLGYNIGLMFRPNDLWSIGLSYRADMDIDYKGDATFTQIQSGNAQFDAIVRSQLPPGQSISTTLAFPAFTLIGVATEIIPSWRIEADITHTSWSRFEALDVNFSNAATPDLHVEQNWEDTYSYRLGANHPISDKWDVRLGAVYDENPQPDEAVGPLLPDSDRTGASFGIGYRGARWSIDITELFLIFADRSTNGRNLDNFNGEYETTANLVSMNLGYHF